MNLEILAPAGSAETLRAAVFAGADALYMGGSLFSARASAANFSDEELREAVAFARERGVRCYITVNTLLKDRELERVMEFAAFLCSLPADGVLVQDMGLFRLLRSCCPGMPLHCSTQMSLHSPAGVGLMEELGAARVVLARELSLGEIEEIHRANGIELEAFVHGALCMSVSGQCYFSAMLGSRSGNRGRCAQTCRLPFTAPGGTGSDLSLKDLSFIPCLPRLAQAGVVSAKIEGRMKRPEYVAAAVAAARQTCDGQPLQPELLESLEAVFSRSGFTDGYLQGTLGREMFGVRTREDVVSGTPALFGKLHQLYRTERPRVPLHLEFQLFAGQQPCLKVWDEAGHQAEVLGEAPAEKAENRPLDRVRICTQLEKLGGTPYYARQTLCHTDGLCALPLSVLGQLRRRAVSLLGLQRQKGVAVPVVERPSSQPLHRARPFTLRGVFRSPEQVPGDLTGLDWVYLPLWTKDADFTALLGRGVKVGAEVPRALFGGAEAAARGRIARLQHLGVQAFLCGNLGAVGLCRELGAAMHGGCSLNITNSEAMAFFEDLGLESAEVSFELTEKEVSALGGALPRGLMVYGRQSLMLTRNCPLANSGRGCLHCKRAGSIADRRGIKFPVMCPPMPENPNNPRENLKCAEVFNSLPLWLTDKLPENSGVDFGVIRFTVENPVEIPGLLSALIRQEAPVCDHTRGLFYRGVV